MSLSHRLDRIREDFLAADVPARMRAALDTHIDRLVAEGAAKRALAAGSSVPDVQFDGITSKRGPARLVALLNRGPVVLTWFRGSW